MAGHCSSGEVAGGAKLCTEGMTFRSWFASGTLVKLRGWETNVLQIFRAEKVFLPY